MQTREFVAAIEKLESVLGLRDFLRFLKTFEKPADHPVSFEIKKEFSDHLFRLDSGIESVLVDPEVSEVAKAFGFDDMLTRPARAYLISLVFNAKTVSDVSTNLLWIRISVAIKHLAAFIGITQRLLAKPEVDAEGDLAGEAIIAIEIHDFESGVEASRLALVIEQFELCYNAVAVGLGERESKLVVEWVDSGSNVVIGFKGVAAVLREIRHMFADAYRGIRFYKHAKVKEDLDTASQQLKFLDDLKERERSGAIEREQCELVRRTVTNSMRTLLGASAFPQTVEIEPEASRRELLRGVRDQRLLTSGSAVAGPGAPEAETDPEEE